MGIRFAVWLAPPLTCAAGVFLQGPSNEEPFTHSLRWKQMNKPVKASRVVADMEDRRGWSVIGVGEISFTTERSIDGTTSLRYRTPTPDWEHIRADVAKHGRYLGGSGKGSHAILTFDEPQDWTAFNRIGLWIYVHPDNVGHNTFYIGFHSLGAALSDAVASWGFVEAVPSAAGDALTPHAISVVHNLTPGQWNRVTWEIAPLARDRVKYFYIYQRLRGPGRPGESWGTYDIDRIELEAVEPEKYAGWAPAPDAAAFCHAGYAPGAVKAGIAYAPEARLFQVIDAATGAVVLTKAVEHVENARGRFAVMDFSEVAAPGAYFLRVDGAATRSFVIGENIWKEAVEKALNFFRMERCGYEVPGVHGVCHQDRFGVHGDVRRVINGGWHDAGDQSQGFWQTAMSVRAMLEIVERLTLLDTEPHLREAMTEEAVWGLDWLLKTRFDDGYRIRWTTTCIYTDGIVGTEDDVVTEATRDPAHNLLCAAVEAHAARVLREARPDLASASRTAAIEDWQAAVEQLSVGNPVPSFSSTETLPAGFRDLDTVNLAWGVLAAMELFELTGERAYGETAAACARLLIASQETEFVAGIPLTGFFYTDPRREQHLHFDHAAFEEVPLMALERLCRLQPDHPDWIEWYKALVLHSEYFLKRGTTCTQPFAMLAAGVFRESDFAGLDPGPKRDSALAQVRAGVKLADGYYLRAFPVWGNVLFHGSTGVHLSMTRALLAAAAARNDRGSRNLAMRQIEWVFGLNPFSKTLMYGAGYDYAPLYSPSAGDIVGALPVGIDSLANDEPWWYDSNYATFKEVWVVTTHKFLSCLATLAWPVPDCRQAAPAGSWVQLGPMSATRRDGNVALTVTARGVGRHEIELRLYNGQVSDAVRKVSLEADVPQELRWEFDVANPRSPWVAVAVPDHDVTAKAETHGS